MPEVKDLPNSTLPPPRNWIDRWDRQQEVYMPDREDRFTALIDAVEASAGRPDPLVLDLGCGPGSLAVRLLARLPEATVVAIDADPVTLALGRAAYADLPGLRFVSLDLRAAGWAARLGLSGRQADAVVSTTALHWLSGAELRDLYATLAGLLRPGGVFLDGDHLREDETSNPVLARLDRVLEGAGGAAALPERAGRPRGGLGTSGGSRSPRTPHWPRPRGRAGAGPRPHGSEGAQFAVHSGALRAAGFAEVGTLWQHGSSRVLCGVR